LSKMMEGVVGSEESPGVDPDLTHEEMMLTRKLEYLEAFLDKSTFLNVSLKSVNLTWCTRSKCSSDDPREVSSAAAKDRSHGSERVQSRRVDPTLCRYLF
jgi:hypothetical protein